MLLLTACTWRWKPGNFNKHVQGWRMPVRIHINYVACLLVLLTVAHVKAQSANTNPYMGQEQRLLKSLSQKEIDALLQGSGMGLAKTAELNHYPGPKHVLELAEQLQLSEKQRQQTQQNFEQMRTQAIAEGKTLLQHETQLERLFQQGDIEEPHLRQILQNIATSRAQLRFTHLSAHLRQVKIMSKAQVARYDQLRGYQQHDAAEHIHHHHH